MLKIIQDLLKSKNWNFYKPLKEWNNHPQRAIIRFFKKDNWSDTIIVHYGFDFNTTNIVLEEELTSLDRFLSNCKQVGIEL